MPLPLLAISAGLGIANGLKGLFGHRGGGGGYTPGNFSYNQNENDNELLLRRRRFLEDSLREHDSTVNEIGRAGLLGSSASFGLLGEADRNRARGLEDINSDVFGKRRQEALQLFMDQEHFKQQRALGYDSGQRQEHMAGLESLGGLGQFAGQALQSYTSGRDNSAGPTRALNDAYNNYEYQLPNRRGRYL